MFYRHGSLKIISLDASISNNILIVITTQIGDDKTLMPEMKDTLQKGTEACVPKCLQFRELTVYCNA